MKNEKSLTQPPVGFKALFSRMSATIRKGPLAGTRWVVSSGGKLVRVLQGAYEVDQTNCFVTEIAAGDCVFDVGAHAGWYTLLSSRLVGKTGHVFSFEASPRNYWYLDRNVTLNKAANVQAFHQGVADKQGFLYFQAGTGTGSGKLADAGEIKVSTVSLDQIVSKYKQNPTHIKIDVEGGEMAVLHGARQLLENHHPLLFLSTHGASIKAECIDYLTKLGYVFESMDTNSVDAVDDFICRYNPTK